MKTLFPSSIQSHVFSSAPLILGLGLIAGISPFNMDRFNRCVSITKKMSHSVEKGSDLKKGNYISLVRSHFDMVFGKVVDIHKQELGIDHLYFGRMQIKFSDITDLRSYSSMNTYAQTILMGGYSLVGNYIHIHFDKEDIIGMISDRNDTKIEILNFENRKNWIDLSKKEILDIHYFGYDASAAQEMANRISKKKPIK